MRNYLKSIGIIFKYSRVSAVIIILTFFLSGVILPLQTFILKNIIESGTANSNAKAFIMWVLFYIVLLLFLLFQNYIQEIAKIILRNKLSEQFELDILNHLNQVSYWCFEDKETHDLINRFSSPAALAADAFLGLLILPQQLLTLIGLAVLFFAASPLFLSVVFIMFFVSLFFNMKEIRNLRKLQIEQTITERKTNYISNLFTDRAAAKEIRLFNLSRYLLRLFNDTTLQMIDERNAVRRKGFKGGVVSQILNMLFIVVGVVALVFLLINDKIEVSQVISLSTALPSLGLISSFYLPNSISELRQKMYTWKDYDTLMKLPIDAFSSQVTELPKNLEIKFENVRFTYPNTNKEILKGVSFTINPGEKVALVGANGCGKSTIIKLMLGLYTVNSGNIYIGDKNIQDISLSLRKELFAAVFQDINVFQISIKENISLSNAAEFNESKIEKYIQQYAFLHFVHETPKLFNTNIGKLDQEGIEISGGEQQRIALARAIYSSSHYVVLDEPTSALDPKAEAELYENFIPIFNERSVIIVSHRLATAKMANKVLVVSDGVIKESGSHDELMQQRGYYYEMFTLQASWYLRNGDKLHE